MRASIECRGIGFLIGLLAVVLGQGVACVYVFFL